jgi:phosphoglycolate phosphatase
MRRPFDLLIFDWDGTLCDSAGPIVSSFQRAIALLQLPARDDASIRRLIGLGGVEALRRLFPEHDTEDLLRTFREYRRSHIAAEVARAPLFPGSLETLQALHADGFELAIATGKTRHGLDESLAQQPAVRALVTHSRCADETADKPHPRMLLELLEVVGVPPARALMIGDTEYDMVMAHAAGVPSVAVACGVHEVPLLEAAGAGAVIDDVRQLPAWMAARLATVAPIPPAPTIAAR